jgi:hypothetical protein
MPGTRRTPLTRTRYPHLSDEAVRLFAHIMERETRGLKRGSAEYDSLAIRLHRLLARKPWDSDILTIDANDPPAHESDSMRFESWCTAVALRRQLEQLISDVPSVDGREVVASSPQ